MSLFCVFWVFFSVFRMLAPMPPARTKQLVKQGFETKNIAVNVLQDLRDRIAALVRKMWLQLINWASLTIKAIEARTTELHNYPNVLYLLYELFTNHLKQKEREKGKQKTKTKKTRNSVSSHWPTKRRVHLDWIIYSENEKPAN